MEEGAPEHLNVSVISEADLKRLSSDPFRQEAPPSPAPAENASAPPPAPEAAPEPTPQPSREGSERRLFADAARCAGQEKPALRSRGLHRENVRAITASSSSSLSRRPKSSAIRPGRRRDSPATGESLPAGRDAPGEIR